VAVTVQDLPAILALHRTWVLSGYVDGACANLTGAYLTGANLAGANLTGATLTGANLTDATLTGAYLTYATLTDANITDANLTGANITYANLTGANLTGATLTGANLTGATLTGANITYANLTGANLTGANLAGANLTYATLTDANLTGANLTGANLTDAYLCGATVDDMALTVRQIVPQEGSFVGFKQLTRGVIAKVRILDDAGRVGGVVGRKCRASAALVLSLDAGGEPCAEGSAIGSRHDSTFLYRVGEVVVPREPFNADRRIECASGIHFLLTREEAEAYG